MLDGRQADQADDYALIATLIEGLYRDAAQQPSLDAVAKNAGLSPHHIQRVFKRWAGVSPKQFLSFLTVETAKRRLAAGDSVLGAALDSGLSGPSRLHDHMVSVEAMTPGAYKAQGAGLKIRYGFAETPFGLALLLLTDRGLAGLTFCEGDGTAAFEEAKARWPLSSFEEDSADALVAAQAVFANSGPDRPLHLKGTNWQIQVWKALLSIPPDTAMTYGAVARMAGSPGAARAAGTAAGSNPIAYVIPCHRVLRATGLFGGYKWGPVRRHAITVWEGSHNSHSE